MRNIFAVILCLVAIAPVEAKEHPRWRKFGRALGITMQRVCVVGQATCANMQQVYANQAASYQAQYERTRPRTYTVTSGMNTEQVTVSGGY